MQPSETTLGLKNKWRERFEFFRAHGSPGSREYWIALRALPWRHRLRIRMNWFAWFFGPFYYFALGLWKKGLSFLGLVVIAIVIEVIFTAVTGIEIPASIDRGFTVGFSVLFGMFANYAYYLKTEKGQQGWNPFEGFGKQ